MRNVKTSRDRLLVTYRPRGQFVGLRQEEFEMVTHTAHTAIVLGWVTTKEVRPRQLIRLRLLGPMAHSYIATEVEVNYYHINNK